MATACVTRAGQQCRVASPRPMAALAAKRSRALAAATPYGFPSSPEQLSEAMLTGSAPEARPASRSGCSCGGECPSCSARSNAKATLRRLAERPPVTVGAGLRVSQPGDVHERQAEDMAAQLAHAPVPHTPDRTTGDPATERLADAASAPPDLAGAPAGVRAAMDAPGRPLDAPVRQRMEEHFGVGFGHVRVHEGGAAHASAAALGARAYTLGNHIVFRDGAYRPDTASGQHTLAHELTHVVQQSGVATASTGLSWSPLSVQPMLQCDLAIEPPHPAAVPRVLTPAEIAAAIAFNDNVLTDLEDRDGVVEMIRDVLGISPTPTVVDQDFVEAVLRWQAMHGLTQDGQLGPVTARPLFREIGAEDVGRCEVTGVSYSVAGPINIAAGGAARGTTFNLLGNFRSDVANGVFPSCCEIRQDIQWDATFATQWAAAGVGAVPHGGFPAAAPAGVFIEDRNAGNTLRYGHRASFSPGVAGNQYLDRRKVNQAFGHRYVGQDNPTLTGAPTIQGRWTFRLRVVDVCHGERRVDSSRPLVLNWL